MVFGGLEGVRWDQRRRRTLVVTMYLWAAIYLFLGFLMPVLGTTLGEWFGVLLLVAILPSCLFALLVSTALRTSVQNLANRKAEELDERQRIVRNRAHYHSYKILGAILLIPLVYGAITAQFFPAQLWLPSRDLYLLVVVFVCLLFYTLPTAVAAWTEPDPEPEGDF